MRIAHCLALMFGCAFPGFVALGAAPKDYGPDDRLGALNLLTPELVVQAVRLIKTGKVYSLALDTAPTETGRRLYRAVVQPIPLAAENRITGFDDLVILSPALGTTMDGLGHAGRNERHYNGVPAEDIYGLNGARVFSMHTLPPIVTRGVLLDVARYRHDASTAQVGAINSEQIRAIEKAQGVQIRRGDVVLLHTGAPYPDPAATTEARPGLGKDGALYLSGLGVVAVGADTGGIEVAPAEAPGERAPVHQILLVDHGVYVFEHVRTLALAADRAYEFLFIAAAPRLVGTVQSNLHPIAIR